MAGGVWRLLGGLAIAGLAAASSVAPAQAGAAFAFDLTFSDGSTAVGSATVNLQNPLNFISSYDVQTSGASGYLYKSGLGLPTPTFADGNLYLTFNRPGYNGFLQLEFSAPANGNGTYVLNLAGSFECINGFQSGNITQNTCSHGTQRFVTSTQSDPADVVVPEPGSLALFGTALLLFGLGWARRRPKV